MDKKEVKKIADKEVKVDEKKMHGVEKGGVTSLDMKKMGRGLAKIAAQKRG